MASPSWIRGFSNSGVDEIGTIPVTLNASTILGRVNDSTSAWPASSTATYLVNLLPRFTGDDFHLLLILSSTVEWAEQRGVGWLRDGRRVWQPMEHDDPVVTHPGHKLQIHASRSSISQPQYPFAKLVRELAAGSTKHLLHHALDVGSGDATLRSPVDDRLARLVTVHCWQQWVLGRSHFQFQQCLFIRSVLPAWLPPSVVWLRL